MRTVVLVFLCQVTFSAGDFLARASLRGKPFNLATFAGPWFVLYLLLHFAALGGEMYIFHSVRLGKAMGLLAAMSIVLSNALGFLFLNETLTTIEYGGIALVLGALVLLSVTPA